MCSKCLWVRISINSQPSVTNNKIWTDTACESLSAGYATVWQGASSTGKKYSNVETCSNWLNVGESSQTSPIKVEQTLLSNSLQSNNMYNFDYNTVIAWGQAGPNFLIYNWTQKSTIYNYNGNPLALPNYDVASITTQGVGANFDSPIINSAQEIVSNAGFFYGNYNNAIYSQGATQEFTPPVPQSDAVANGTLSAIQMPQICHRDARYNVSGTIYTILESGGISYTYPISYVTYCSWNGSQVDLFDSYSTAVQLFGGITMNQLFSSGTNLNICSYTPGGGGSTSNTSMLCPIPGIGNIFVNLEEQFSDLQLGSYPSFVMVVPITNGWLLNIQYQ
ncbi:MAG: hypothetical protein K2X04_11125 [Burkholderiales bacterium]|nr:hypothetical protein [Burkholderiales bacterium]